VTQTVTDAEDGTELLYHYTTTAGLIGIIESGHQWATDARFLNDVSEGTYGQDVCREAIRITSEEQGYEGARLAALSLASQWFHPDAIPASSIVVCFSAQRDQLSQWRAYGAGGGFAIGFDRTSLEERRSFQSATFRLAPVKYDRSEQLKDAGSEIRLRLGAKFDERPSETVPQGTRLAVRLFLSAAYFKHKAFEEEEEWRAVAHVPLSPCPLSFRASPFGPIPYGVFPLQATEDDGSPIREVRVGPTGHPATVRRGVELLLTRHGLNTADRYPVAGAPSVAATGAESERTASTAARVRSSESGHRWA
jgi:hypothetical protein